jgi:phosphohistidine phosphatase
MALYLVQHGKSLPKEVDPEQGLSPEGFADVRRIAGVAAGYGVKLALIGHSGKKRAVETAEIFAEALFGDKSRTAPLQSIGPLDDVATVAGGLEPGHNIMMVGHLPFLERLAGLLVAGSTERVVFKFQNGGIVCLDKTPDSRWWFIKWALMPRID